MIKFASSCSKYGFVLSLKLYGFYHTHRMCNTEISTVRIHKTATANSKIISRANNNCGFISCKLHLFGYSFLLSGSCPRQMTIWLLLFWKLDTEKFPSWFAICNCEGKKKVCIQMLHFLKSAWEVSAWKLHYRSGKHSLDNRAHGSMSFIVVSRSKCWWIYGGLH